MSGLLTVATLTRELCLVMDNKGVFPISSIKPTKLLTASIERREKVLEYSLNDVSKNIISPFLEELLFKIPYNFAITSMDYPCDTLCGFYKETFRGIAAYMQVIYGMHCTQIRIGFMLAPIIVTNWGLQEL